MTLDQFYTKPHISLQCYDKLKEHINVDDFDIVMEPSAGTGSFYKLLPEDKRYGIDLEPKCEAVIKMNFFDFLPDPNKKYLIIGNPPFGRICSTAIKFFNKASSFSHIIAMIVPRTMKRVSVQNKLNLNFHLIYNQDLPLTPCCFEPKMSAKCCFQIWIKKDIKRDLIVYDKIHSDFKFLKLGEKDKNKQPTPPHGADFVIKAYGGGCGKIQRENLSTLRPKSWHWIVSNIDVEELINRFNSLNYDISKDTVRQDSIGQQEVINLYKERFN